MREIKAAIFDVGGVLCDEGLQAMIADMKQSLGIDDTVIKDIFKNDIPLIGSGKIDETEFWKRIASTYGTRQVSVSENLLGRAYAEALKPQEEVLKLIKRLGESGIVLAILSNTVEQHATPLRAAGIYDNFDNVYLSHEIGLRKPDPSAYNYVLDDMEVSAPETIFVDDRFENVKTANELGMHGIVYENPEQLLADIHQLVPNLN